MNCAADTLIMICRKFSEKIFLRTRLDNPFDSYFNGRLMFRQLTDLNFGWIKLMKVVLSLIALRDIFPSDMLDLCCIHLLIRILEPVKYLKRTFLRELLTASD